MKIIADENIPNVHEFFDRFGDVITLPGRDVRAHHVKDADVLLVRSVTPVNAELLDGSAVKFVGTCTIGIDHLDTSYLAEKGITYASAPGCNAGGVVQYVLSALASIDDGSFEKKIGVIGSGNVGGRVCKALLSMGVDTVAYDPYLDKTQNPVLTDLGEVLACDIICMHVPYTQSGLYPTHHLINHNNLPLLKPGAILLNAGRGGAIDNLALKEHLQMGADLKVILDVWENEPNIDMELLDLVAFATPHIAGYSFEGRVNGSAMIFAELSDYLGKASSETRKATQAIYSDTFGPSTTIRCCDVNEAILASYRIRYDDLRTRTSLKQAQTVGREFDALRKSYPQRREFGHFKVETKNTELKRKLVSIGFIE